MQPPGWRRSSPPKAARPSSSPRSGVAQGWPGRGWLFAVAFDAPVRILTNVVAGNGACADDIASVCGEIRVVGRFASPLGVIERATRVGLRPTMILVLVAAAGRLAEPTARMRAWLMRDDPLLSEIEVVPGAKALGFTWGRAAWASLGPSRSGSGRLEPAERPGCTSQKTCCVFLDGARGRRCSR